MRLSESDIRILTNCAMLIRLRWPAKDAKKIGFITRGTQWIMLGSGIVRKTEKITKKNLQRICSCITPHASLMDVASLKEKLKANKFACAVYFKSVEWAEDGHVHPEFCPINMHPLHGITNRSVTHSTHPHSKLKGRCPEPNLRSTADHFLDYLKPADHAELDEMFGCLGGVTIRIATTCSGGDVFVTAWRKTIEAMNARFSNLVT